MEDNERSIISYEAVQNYVPDSSPTPDQLADGEEDEPKEYSESDLLRIIVYLTALDLATWKVIRDIIRPRTTTVNASVLANTQKVRERRVRQVLQRIRERHPELAAVISYAMERRTRLKPRRGNWGEGRGGDYSGGEG